MGNLFTLSSTHSNTKNIFDQMGKAYDHYSEKYENFVFMGDFNLKENEEGVINFMNCYGLKNLVKKTTCDKSEPGKCIDLIIINHNRSFWATKVIETGLSDFHKMVVTVLKTTFQNLGPTIVNYRN